MSNHTADGLRERLFTALDRVIDKTISNKEVESVCFVSEQIIKTARVELETLQEMNRNSELERQHDLRVLREQQDSIKLIENVMEANIEEGEDGSL